MMLFSCFILIKYYVRDVELILRIILIVFVVLFCYLMVFGSRDCGKRWLIWLLSLDLIWVKCWGFFKIFYLGLLILELYVMWIVFCNVCIWLGIIYLIYFVLIILFVYLLFVLYIFGCFIIFIEFLFVMDFGYFM